VHANFAARVSVAILPYKMEISSKKTLFSGLCIGAAASAR